MVDDIDRILSFVGERTLEEFLADEQACFAVSYAYIRIGEAIASVPQEVLDAHSEIEWRKIRHFRNFMVHVYHAVDPAHLYRTARDNLPELRINLERVLAQAF
jgi:uncharacterized protein with HEPN domain